MLQATHCNKSQLISDSSVGLFVNDSRVLYSMYVAPWSDFEPLSY